MRIYRELLKGLGRSLSVEMRRQLPTYFKWYDERRRQKMADELVMLREKLKKCLTGNGRSLVSSLTPESVVEVTLIEARVRELNELLRGYPYTLASHP